MSLYIGIIQGGGCEIFSCATVPTAALWSGAYLYAIGPFKTRRGAEFMRDHGHNNPHCQSVAQAERLARKGVAMTDVAKVIKANGTVEILDHKPTLEEAQTLVGGYVELARARDPETGELGQLLMDEEGKLKRKPVNLVACGYWPDGIVGDVLFLTGKRKWK